MLDWLKNSVVGVFGMLWVYMACLIDLETVLCKYLACCGCIWHV